MPETADDGSVKITLVDVYDAVGDLGKLVNTLVERDKGSTEIHSDHERRIRLLEGRAAKLAGALALVTLVMPALCVWLAHLLTAAHAHA